MRDRAVHARAVSAEPQKRITANDITQERLRSFNKSDSWTPKACWFMLSPLPEACSSPFHPNAVLTSVDHEAADVLILIAL